MKITHLITTLCALSLVSGPVFSQTADAIYHGGSILTMAGKNATYAEALAVKDGKIAFVGTKEAALKMKGDATKIVDLDGKHLMPSFIDAHGHFINSLSLANQANCYAAPFGAGSTKEGILEALKKTKIEKKIADNDVLIGYGYDDSIYPDGGKLTAADLDTAFPAQAVMVMHVSLHGAVLNSAAMKKYNISAATETAPGGVIVRKPGTNEPEGLIMETAFLPIFAQMPKPTPEQEMDALVGGQKIFAAAGVTTAHEGATHLDQLQVLQRGAKAGKLFIDVIAFPFITDIKPTLRANPPETFSKYINRLKLGGIKVTIDGSPQGRTAHFTTPYLTGGPGGEKDWKGEPTFPEPEIRKMVKAVYDLNVPLIIHCNGDAAIDNFLTAHEAALGDAKAGDHRSGIIHCQFVRKDQLDKIAAWKIIPSFYTEHTYFYGTTHTKQRGKEQTDFLSPLKSALDRGITFGNHTDFNVAPIDQLFVVWSAVNRLSREGEVIGADERISAYEALKAVTCNVAYWYREEATKGTLETGKLADLVILDKDPLKVEPMAIKDIKVMETIKEGTTIYSAN
jgi:predicted amidohydrolase YtcJ